jgi:hypothetical protein
MELGGGSAPIPNPGTRHCCSVRYVEANRAVARELATCFKTLCVCSTSVARPYLFAWIGEILVACETSRLARVIILLDRNHATSQEVSLDVDKLNALMPYN